MNELTLINKNGIYYADSRQVAEMTEKEHAHLMRDIKGYETILSENPDLDSQDFFTPDTYKVKGNNKTYPCYLLTKKGCDMVANKMSGEKGVLFTAAYINRFYEMEQELETVPKITSTNKPRYRQRMISTAIKDVASTANSIMKLFSIREGMAIATAIDMVEETYAINLAPIKKLVGPAKHKTGFLTPTEIGMKRGGEKAKGINMMLCDLGLQIQEIGAKGKKIWRLTELGKNYAEEKPYKNNGHSGYQIVWNENVLSLLATKEGVAQ